MKGAEELGELLFECNKVHDKVLDWSKQHENDEVFKTKDGKILRSHLGEMVKREALAMCVLGTIELIEAMQHPDIFISSETYEAFRECMNSMEYEAFIKQE